MVAAGFKTVGSEFKSRYNQELFFTSSIDSIVGWSHPAFYPAGSRDSFSRGMRPEREAIYLLPTSAEIMKICIYTSNSPNVLLA
jgi:hypothetical protein